MNALSFEQSFAAALRDPERGLVELDRLDSVESLIRFVGLAWRTLEPPSRPFVHGWHMDAICDHLQAITAGHLRRLLINVPPGFSKSVQTCVYWQAWEWGPKGMPWSSFITGSHSEDLAIRDALRFRRVVDSAWYRARWPIHWRRDEAAKTRLANTEGGYRITTSVGGGTGDRADRFVVDDPHQVHGAESDAIRQNAVRWFRETVPSRLNDPVQGAIVVIMQRVHEADVSGEILERMQDQGFVHLMLPMRFEPERRCTTVVQPGGAVDRDRPHPWDQRERDGTLLDSERFPEPVVRQLESALGGYAAAGQLQQRPAPRGGGLLPVTKLEFVKDWPRDATFVRSWDFAATDPKRQKNPGDPDYTVGGLVGFKDGRYWIVDVQRCRRQPAEVERLARQTAALDGLRVPIIFELEGGASGKANADHLQRQVLPGYSVTPIPASGSKVERARPLASAMEAGNVLMVEGPWNTELVAEMRNFPHSRHDDQVDAIAQAVIHLGQSALFYIR